MRHFRMAWIALFSTTAALAQQPAELGIRAGATFTHGFTALPARPVSAGVEIPRIRNSNDGIGVGYVAGIWARKPFRSFFLQAGVEYQSVVLKQTASIARTDVLAASSFNVEVPALIQPGQLFASLNVATESTLNSVNVPLHIGKTWKEGRFRIYAGPSLMFSVQSSADRTVTGRIEPGRVGPNGSIPFPGGPIDRADKVDLLDRKEAGPLQIKKFNFSAEGGVGLTLLNRLEADLRYTLPVGGIFNDSGITGFIGFAALSLSYRLAGF
ncbi:outer membrane beta-barrel protein [Larkinella soli]|uniref:outer membrane beta-barrel protein n=1 Tax=Larkinella soli TaxID=1770527 RepID=UPI000FFC8407|nr:outer membrane beta-barrel protein [Larkinella soli]